MEKDTLYPQFFEALELIRAVREGSPFKIRFIIALIPHARQDRQTKQREPAVFKLICDLIFTAGADEVYTLHLHNMATAGFFGEIGSKARMENVSLNDFFLDLLVKKFPKNKRSNLLMASPDISAGKNARWFAQRLGVDTVIVDKDRKANAGNTKVMQVFGGKISGLNVVFVDDMIGSGGSCVNAANAVRARGAKDIYMIASHLVYTEETWDNLRKANFKEIWVTDTCPFPKDKILPNMKVFSVDTLIARIIDNAHNGKSVSDLWHNSK